MLRSAGAALVVDAAMGANVVSSRRWIVSGRIVPPRHPVKELTPSAPPAISSVRIAARGAAATIAESVSSEHTSRMDASFAAFLAISAVVIVTPGRDTALKIRNTLLGGRSAGVATAGGVAVGQATWTLAARPSSRGRAISSAGPGSAGRSTR